MLVTVHVGLCAIALLRSDVTDDSDITRFAQIGSATGTPWRDFPVEYAPGETLVILALPNDTTRLALAVALVALASDLIIARLLAIWRGKVVATAYLMAMLPLLTFIFYRLDLLVVAAVVAGTVLLMRNGVLGGSLLGASVLMKAWPLIVTPLLVRTSRRGALSVGVIVMTGGLAWLAWGGLDAPVQVGGFRGARGWSVESTVGSLVWLATDEPVAIEAGAPRIGVALLQWRLLLLTLLVGAWVMVERLSRRWEGEALGVPSLAALGALLVASPLFSLQYASWIAPSAALAWAEPQSRRAAVPAFVTIGLTGLVFAVVQRDGGGPMTQLAVLARNASVVWMTAAAMRALARAGGPQLDDAK